MGKFATMSEDQLVSCLDENSAGNINSPSLGVVRLMKDHFHIMFMNLGKNWQVYSHKSGDSNVFSKMPN